MKSLSSFYDLIQKCSLLEKKTLLLTLQDIIRKEETSRNMPIPTSKLTDLVEYVPNFIPSDADDLVSGIHSELKSFDSLKPCNEVTSQWLSLINEPYSFGRKTYNAKDLQSYQYIHKLMGMVNNHPSTTGDANSCLISFYTDHNICCRLHADDEKTISQTSSITTISFGATRNILFTRGHYIERVKTLNLVDRSAFIMKAGCQQYLQHELLQGCHGSGPRYCISFRKSVSPDISPFPAQKQSSSKVVRLAAGSLLLSPPTPETSPSSISSPLDFEKENRPPSKTSTPIKAAVIFGDSYGARLKAEKLSKDKIKVINMCTGGAKISKTEEQVEQFYTSDKSVGLDITHVFISVGTNDIRYCYNGVRHLKAPLRRLLLKIKLCFPTARVHIHSLLPIAPENPTTCHNVCELNEIIFELCRNENVFFLDFFDKFVDEWGYRCDYLFEDSVHPHSRAMGRIARIYIRILHRQSFNPLAF